MKLTVVLTICLVLILNYTISSSQPIVNQKRGNLRMFKPESHARQAYNSSIEYYDDDNDDDDEESLSEENYDGDGKQLEKLKLENPKEEDASYYNESEEADEEQEYASDHSSSKQSYNQSVGNKIAQGVQKKPEGEYNKDYNDGDGHKEDSEEQEEYDYDDDEEEEEDDDDDEEDDELRFMENSAFLSNIFDIL